MKSHCVRLALSTILVLVVATGAGATTIDLRSSSQGTINQAIFTINNLQPAGSGVIDPFLTVQNGGSEQGYNGTNNNFDTKRVPKFNHPITLGSLAVFTLNGTPYYQFLVDVNEPNGRNQNLIALDMLKVYTSSTTQSSTATSGGVFNGSLGNLVYSLDAGGDNRVLYDDQHHGSGQADITIFIPTSLFTAANRSDYVYMYQGWGYSSGFSTGGGFEETAALTSVATVPEPGTVLLLGTGLVTGIRVLRRRRG